jgi:glycerophosphoryl diester phosphodiesterase
MGWPAAQTAIFAHRGAWGAAPENSLPAFAAAIELGVDGIELDVRCTADRRLIVYHDAEVGGVPVASRRYAELTVKGGPGPPPRLEEVLELTAGRIALDLEIKAPGYTGEVLSALTRYDAHDCLVTSFLDEVLREVARRAPQLRRGLLIGPDRLRERANDRRRALTRMRRCQAELLGLELALLDAGWLAAQEIQDRPCLVWTVNTSAGMSRCLNDPAVSGLITDDPAQALRLREISAGELSA